MQKLISLLLILSLFGGVGCKQFDNGENQSKYAMEGYKEFVRQARSADMIHIVGTEAVPASFTMTGIEITMKMPVSPLSIQGDDNSKQAMYGAIENIFRAGMVYLGIKEMSDWKQGGSTTNNYNTPAP